jgi:pilus assembly protein CpaB
MLKRRLLAAVAALLMASIGAVLLTSYVTAADSRAMAGLQTTEVLVVTSVIAKETAADALGKRVEPKTLPATAVAPGAVTSLGDITGLVSTVDLQPGEQLLRSRFVDPATLRKSGEFTIPAGLQQVSVALERPRMLGSLLTPGTTVGLFLSMPKDGSQPAQTHLILNKVLVTKVGEDVPATADGDNADAPDPAASVVVTFAVSAADAEKIVFGAEHGRLYLSLEPSDVATAGTRVVTPGNVYR